MGDEPVELDEAAGIEKEVEAFARGELALLVLLGNPGGASSLLRQRLPATEFLEPLLLGAQFAPSFANPLRSIFSTIPRAAPSSPPCIFALTTKRSPTSTVSSLRLSFVFHSSRAG